MMDGVDMRTEREIDGGILGDREGQRDVSPEECHYYCISGFNGKDNDPGYIESDLRGKPLLVGTYTSPCSP